MIIRHLAVILWLGSTLVAADARCEIFATEHFRLSGDFRGRLESDFDSSSADGTERADRLRMRIRARLALDCSEGEHLSFGLRLRSGSRDSHQSPHITVVDLNGNDTGDADLTLDRWYGKGQWSSGWAWLGRNSFPFWKQNELYWDDDVTLMGAAGGLTAEAGVGTFQAIGGHFSLPVGMRSSAGDVTGLQLVYGRPSKGGDVGSRIKASLAWLALDANPDDPDARRLLSANGARDYSLLVASLQLGFRAAGRPLVLGADLLHNGEDYSASDPDPITAANFDQTDGFVVSLIWGQSSERGDWLTGYTYARIETFAVNASYAGDDWVRWGSAHETRPSNLKGHELRLGYRLRKGADLLARYYLVDSITTVEDGKRFRLDLNLRF